MCELTETEIKAIRKVLVHFLDGGWREMLENLHSDEARDDFFDAIESAQAKLLKLARGKAA